MRGRHLIFRRVAGIFFYITAIYLQARFAALPYIQEATMTQHTFGAGPCRRRSHDDNLLTSATWLASSVVSRPPISRPSSRRSVGDRPTKLRWTSRQTLRFEVERWTAGMSICYFSPCNIYGDL